MEAELKETRLEKLSFAAGCDLDGASEETVGNGEDRLEVGGVGRKAAKAANPFVSVLDDQSQAERSSIFERRIFSMGAPRYDSTSVSRRWPHGTIMGNGSV